MNIGIDARGLDGKKAGIPTYIERILEEIGKIDDKQNKYILYSTKKINLDIKENSKIIINEDMQKKRTTEAFGYILNYLKF